MINKKYLFPIALLISLLIILIPIAVATEIEAYDNLVLKTSEQKTNLYQFFGSDESSGRTPGDRTYLSDPGKACVSQHEQTSSYADSLDNSIISTLEKIATALFVICTTMTAIDTVVNKISLAVGMISGDFCCPAAVTPPGAAACVTAATSWQGWSITFEFIKPICCFVNCGWCTGADCWGAIFPFHLGKIGDLGFLGPGAGIAQIQISPYDNIYTAIGCLCPIAVIFNLRKLKTIYDVYDCCIQEACENSLSTQACEKQLDEATCMYWEGSLYSMLARILMSLLASKLLGPIIEQLAQSAFMDQFLACLYAGLKIAQAINVIDGVKNAWTYATRTFNKPYCEDLGFDRIKELTEAAMREAAEEGFEDVDESLLENWHLITMIDKDNDGIYDYHAPKWGEPNSEGVSTTTIRSKDEKTGEYTSKIYYKKAGIVYENPELSDDDKVGTFKWWGIQGSNEPATMKIFSDGSASIGDTYGTFEIKGSEIIYNIKDEKGKVISIEPFTNPKDLDVRIGNTGLNINDYDDIVDGKLVTGEEDQPGYEALSIEFDEKEGKATINIDRPEIPHLPGDEQIPWSSEKTGKEAAEEKKTEGKKTNLAQEELKKEMTSQAMYEFTWTLLDVTLGEEINDMVKGMCKEDSGKSYPPSDEPTDGNGGIGECKGIKNNIYNAQFISKTDLNQTCEYAISYSIKTCGSAINYTILLSGTANNEMIETGSIGFQQTISRNRVIKPNICTHQAICITADDGHNQCYPPTAPGGWES